ncbi:MAG TPA: tyrosine-protein phosphatase [Thermoanaerobaculia bacterium]|nr:tyrosine-protein phosphatase [Thermoanaerobaculia bacterium]
MSSTAPISRRAGHVTAMAVLLLLAAVVAGGSFFLIRGSTRLVVDGVYRSAQPRERDLHRLQREGIRTVVNLRGPNPGHDWYEEERESCERLGLGLVSLRFETFDWPPQHETRELVHTLEHRDRPILLHCASGTDRSGWAAALVRALEGEPLDHAIAEMSWIRGHFCEGWGDCPLHRFFAMYEQWLASEGLEHSGATLRRWVTEVYAPGPYDAEVVLERPVPRLVTPDSEIATMARVTNRSPLPWPATADRQTGMRLGARILGPYPTLPSDPLEEFRRPHTPARDMFRSDMQNRTTRPGESRLVDVRFAAPGEPGRYLIQIDMVDEMVHWFSDLGGPGVVESFEVVGGDATHGTHGTEGTPSMRD